MKLAATFLLTGILTVRAGVTLSLNASVKNAARGATLTFSGTVTNTGASDVCLNDATFSLAGGAGTHLTPGTSVFFPNVPGILLPGESYTGELFQGTLSTTALAGSYSGAVALKGGADQVAADTLATGPFSVLSSDVNVVASDASASEYGPDAGVLTVSRNGPTDIALEVPVSFSGSAVNGTAYQTVPAVVVIAAGATSAPVTIQPIPDNIAQGDRTATITVQSSGSYNTGAPSSASVTVHDKPADAWRLEKFGANANTPAAADKADWNADGIENQMAYALGLDPVGFSLSALPVAAVSGGFYQLSWTPNPEAIDMIFTAEASTDLSTWSSANLQPVAGPPGTTVYRYQTPVAATPRVYLRLRAARNGQ